MMETHGEGISDTEAHQTGGTKLSAQTKPPRKIRNQRTPATTHCGIQTAQIQFTGKAAKGAVVRLKDVLLDKQRNCRSPLLRKGFLSLSA